MKAVRAAADLLRGAERGGANTRGRDLPRAVQASRHLLKVTVQNSVADPDPYVFGPPGSGSGSSRTRYGSGSSSTRWIRILL